MNTSDKTQFGYEEVSVAEKSKRVDDVFNNCADVYDKMNDTMSFGIHRFWKKQAVCALDCHTSDTIADIACGTGDISQLILPHIPEGKLYCIDPNQSMLEKCCERLGHIDKVSFIQTAAEQLVMPEKLDKVIISFGLRNFSDPNLGLKNIYDNMSVGGKIVIMEFNPPESTVFKNQYALYLKHMLPCLGKYIGQDEASYQYLADSIAVQPAPKARLNQLKEAGFEFLKHTPMTMGVVGLFEGYRCR